MYLKQFESIKLYLEQLLHFVNKISHNRPKRHGRHEHFTCQLLNGFHDFIH